MFAQYGIGKPKGGIDSKDNRLIYFQSCLNLMIDSKELKGQVICFPWKIGCGMAGGDWSVYKPCLDQWISHREKLGYGKCLFVEL